VAGGGDGGLQLVGANATANTGSGGGGGGYTVSSTYAGGGSGGSGIVIIRYPATQSAPTATTGSPQILYADSYQIYVFTSSGTITF
jgi:hypothetical protein